MAKKAATNPAPEPVVSEVPETEATTSTAIDQPAVTDDASASSPSSDAPEPSEPVSDLPSKEVASEEGSLVDPSSPAEPAISEPVAIQGGGGSFESPFAEAKPALTMVERIGLLEKRVAALEEK